MPDPIVHRPRGGGGAVTSTPGTPAVSGLTAWVPAVGWLRRYDRAFAEVRGPLRDMFERAGIDAETGQPRVFRSMSDAMAAFEAGT